MRRRRRLGLWTAKAVTVVTSLALSGCGWGAAVVVNVDTAPPDLRPTACDDSRNRLVPAA